MERSSVPPPLPASEPASAAPPEAGYYLEEEVEDSEEEESLTARAEVHWDEASTDGEVSEELEMTEGEDNMELMPMGLEQHTVPRSSRSRCIRLTARLLTSQSGNIKLRVGV